MNKRILFFTLLISFSAGTLTFGQIARAKKQMALYNYSQAMLTLTKSMEKEKTDKREATLLMAECYSKQHDVQRARQYYAKTIGYGNAAPSTLYSYAQVLRSCGEYGQAREVFLQYDALVPGDTRARIMAGYCDSAVAWKDIPPAWEVKNASTLNSKESEFGPVFYENLLCFTSDRKSPVVTGKKYGWTGNGYLRLYYAEPVYADNFNNDFKEIRVAPDLLNQTYHDGPACFNRNFSEIFINRTIVYRDKGKKGQDKIRTHLLKIYQSERKDSKWTEPQSFVLNNKDYSVGHPALSRDGKVLYFVSDMKGGFGGTDLYMSRRGAENKWSDPVNLGPVINTFGDEMFPGVSDNGDFYYASEGQPGFGGLDLFITRQMDDSTWFKPQNLGQAVNSSYDDFALSMSKNNTNGLFSSNRPGGQGSDDIYLFSRLEKPREPVLVITYLSGYVKDKTTLEPIDNATVFFLDKEKDQVLILKTDLKGYYKTQITPGTSYVAKAMKTGYIADCYLFTPDTISQDVERTAPRDLLLDRLHENRTFVLDNIYYDLDKYNIRPDAEPALDKLVVIMKENPVNIELGSHCDSRASDAYNMILSQNRAESAVHYIVSRGIAQLRLTAKGYGETQLVNECKNEVPCTDEQHQLNRRTTFRAISGYEDVKEETIQLKRYKKGEMMDARLLNETFFDICK